MASLAKKWMAKTNNSNISDNSSSNQPEMKIVQPAPPVSKDISVLQKSEQNPEPQWQNDFCLDHGGLNNWRGQCPRSVDNCLLSRIMDIDKSIDEIEHDEIIKGVNCGEVAKYLHLKGENEEPEKMNPLWFLCIAEALGKAN